VAVKRQGNLRAKLARLTADMTRELGAAVYVVAGNVQTDAQISLSTGAVGGANHVPSAPGTPPNSDTGALANSIEVERVEALRARVVVHSPYGAIQELGGTINHPGGTAFFIGDDGLAVFISNEAAAGKPYARTKPHTITLPERPYMRPAAAKNRDSGRRLMEAAVDRVLKGGKLA
jgi:phage gpG-like protein